jgi:hypothetical protein
LIYRESTIAESRCQDVYRRSSLRCVAETLVSYTGKSAVTMEHVLESYVDREPQVWFAAEVGWYREFTRPYT